MHAKLLLLASVGIAAARVAHVEGPVDSRMAVAGRSVEYNNGPAVWRRQDTDDTDDTTPDVSDTDDSAIPSASPVPGASDDTDDTDDGTPDIDDDTDDDNVVAPAPGATPTTPVVAPAPTSDDTDDTDDGTPDVDDDTDDDDSTVAPIGTPATPTGTPAQTTGQYASTSTPATYAGGAPMATPMAGAALLMAVLAL